MAERRMFAKTIIDSDAFLEMPLSTQALYFHLSMRADDEGFINNPRKIQRTIGCADDDLKLLIHKNFIIPFESGIVVIKHWFMHNYIRKDRLQETVYQDEKAELMLKENESYTVRQTECGHLSGTCQSNVSIGKDSIGKDSIGNIKDIVDFLNQKAGTNYKYTSANTAKHINARLADGYTLEQFQIVIEKKAVEWKDTDMGKYLCPDTLFGSKFEKYLNQPDATESKTHKACERSESTGQRKNTSIPATFDCTDL